MRTRTTLATALTLALAAGGAAHAATKPKPKPPICNLVVDPAGDTLTGTKSLDVLSADVASDAKVVTVVVRLAKAAAPASDPTTPTGGFFQVGFTYNGTGQNITAHVTPAGEVYGPDGKGTGRFDLAKNEVHITVKASDLAGAPVLKPGALFTDFVVRTDVGNPTVPISTTFQVLGDTATGSKPYPIGAASCVRPGA
jgi:hypothetical protein